MIKSIMEYQMNQKLFEAFYETHFAKVVNRLRKAHLIKEDAEDLAQNIFLELFAKYDDYYLTQKGYFWWFVNVRLYNFVISRDTQGMYKQYWQRRSKEETEFFIWFEKRREFMKNALEDEREYKGLKVKDVVLYILQNGITKTRHDYGKKLDKIFEMLGGEE